VEFAVIDATESKFSIGIIVVAPNFGLEVNTKHLMVDQVLGFQVVHERWDKGHTRNGTRGQVNGTKADNTIDTTKA